MALVIFIIIYVAICIALAVFVGSKREIGFGWSLFFCLTLTVIGGLIFTLISPVSNPNQTPKRRKMFDTASNSIGSIGSIIFLLVGLISFFVILNEPTNPFADKYDKIRKLVWSIGFVGIGVYGLELLYFLENKKSDGGKV